VNTDDAWQLDQRARYVLAEAERRACDLCDDAGYRPNRIVCDHVDRTEIAARGVALCRDVLKLNDLRKQTPTNETNERNHG